MEKASREEKLRAEEATGVVSRKASPDGYRYEDRETGEPVDPDAYKGPYLGHVGAVRASRVQEFAARRVTAPSSASALPEAVSGSAAGAGVIASFVSGAPVAAAAGEVGEARSDGDIPPAAPVTTSNLATGAANDVVSEESPKVGRLPGDISLPGDVLVAEIGSDDMPSEETGDAATAAEEDEVIVGRNGVEAEDENACVVGEVNSPAVSLEAEARAPATSATVVAEEGVSPGDAATRVAATETPIAIKQESAVAAGTAGGQSAAKEGTAFLESETLIAVAPTAEMAGAVEDGGGDDNPGVEDAKSCGGALDGVPAVVAVEEVETLSSGSAAGTVCSPGAASAYLEAVPMKPEEPGEACDLWGGATAAVSPVSHVDQESPPHGCRPDSSGGVSGERGDGMSTSHLSEAPPSPALASDGGIVSPITGSPECAEPFRDEACGDDDPLSFSGSGQGGGLEQPGVSEAEVSPASSTPFSPPRSDPLPRGSVEHGKSDGGAAAGLSPFSTSTYAAAPAAAVAAAAAASPLVATGGYEHQQEGLLSGGVPVLDERVQREFPSRERLTPPNHSSNAGSPAMSEIAASPGEGEEGAEEIAALEERLWAAWDAAVLEYEEGVALVRSRCNRQAPTPAVSAIAQEESAVASRSSADAAAPTPTAGKVADTSGQEETTSASSGSRAAATPVPCAAGAAEAVAEPAVAVTTAGGMHTPDSPLLPLLQLRLEEEEGDLFEYSSSWRGSAAGGGDGSSQARGGKPRRRSLARAFSLQKTQKEGPCVQEQAVSMTAGKSQGAAGAATREKGESEIEGSGGSDRTAVALCRLCCRKACDTVLHPCEHSACGVCVEKIRLQTEQSGQALSCPWDRKFVDDIRPL